MNDEGQRGHLMAGVLVMLAIMLIFTTVVFQDWQEVARRDAEAEMIFRAEEIVRAIVRYRKSYGTTPQKLEDLMEPGPKGQYFMRRLYEDPLVKDGQWGLLYAGPGGTIIDPSLQAEGAGGLPFGGGGIGGIANERGRDRGTSRGVDPRRGLDTERSGESRLDGGAGDAAVAGQGGQVGIRLAGVKSLCTDKPFRVYKGLTEYREWLFTYLDLEKVKVPGQDRRRRGDTGQPGSQRQRDPNSPRGGTFGNTGRGSTRRR